MKKQYIIPTLQLVNIKMEQLIAVSPAKYDTGGGDQLVKGDRGAERGSRSDNYNVWNDDWSK